MTIRRIEPGPRMSQAVVHGDTVYLAGQVGAPGASVADQTRAVLAQIDRLLAEAGSDKSRILSATIWLADIGTFAEMNAYANNVKRNNRPAPGTAPKEIELLDVQDQTAAAKLTAWWGTDYLLLAKYDGRWMIVHVLWQTPPRAS